MCFVSLLHDVRTLQVLSRTSALTSTPIATFFFADNIIYSDVSMLLLETPGPPPPLSPHGPKHWKLNTSFFVLIGQHELAKNQ